MAVTAYKFLSDPEIRLYLLHGFTRGLGNAARVLGLMALKSEKAYYEVVDSFPH